MELTEAQAAEVAACHFYDGEEIEMSDRVLREEFDRARVIGKTLAEVEAMTELDWMDAYPIVEERDGVQVVAGIVDANYPNTFNDGHWRIVDDRYAVAGKSEETE